jgi:hypothetical protein
MHTHGPEYKIFSKEVLVSFMVIFLSFALHYFPSILSLSLSLSLSLFLIPSSGAPPIKVVEGE